MLISGWYHALSHSEHFCNAILTLGCYDHDHRYRKCTGGSGAGSRRRRSGGRSSGRGRWQQTAEGGHWLFREAPELRRSSDLT